MKKKSNTVCGMLWVIFWPYKFFIIFASKMDFITEEWIKRANHKKLHENKSLKVH